MYCSNSIEIELRILQYCPPCPCGRMLLTMMLVKVSLMTVLFKDYLQPE